MVLVRFTRREAMGLGRDEVEVQHAALHRVLLFEHGRAELVEVDEGTLLLEFLARRCHQRERQLGVGDVLLGEGVLHLLVDVFRQDLGTPVVRDDLHRDLFGNAVGAGVDLGHAPECGS